MRGIPAKQVMLQQLVDELGANGWQKSEEGLGNGSRMVKLVHPIRGTLDIILQGEGESNSNLLGAKLTVVTEPSVYLPGSEFRHAIFFSEVVVISYMLNTRQEQNRPSSVLSHYLRVLFWQKDAGRPLHSYLPIPDSGPVRVSDAEIAVTHTSGGDCSFLEDGVFVPLSAISPAYVKNKVTRPPFDYNGAVYSLEEKEGGLVALVKKLPDGRTFETVSPPNLFAMMGDKILHAFQSPSEWLNLPKIVPVSVNWPLLPHAAAKQGYT